MPNENKDNLFIIHGALGGNEGAKGRLPQNDPDGVLVNNQRVVSLTQIEVLDLLSEGEIEGLVSGTYSPVGRQGQIGWDKVDFTPYPSAPGTTSKFLKSIYWNETPVVDPDNKFNFQSVNLKYTPGRPNGSTSAEKIRDESTVTRVIGERLRGGINNFKTYRILNNNCKGVKINVKFGVLNQTNVSISEYGDVEDTTVKYSIYYRPLFSNIQVANYRLGKEESVQANIANGFINQSTINFTFNDTDFVNEPYFLGWEIKIVRSTPDSTSSNLRNQSAIDSITEIYGNTFIYPSSAIVSSKFSAEYFAQIPNRAYDTKLLKVKIPSNYDPITKKYTGTWDGTFADDKQWTDNPAWCYYDLLTNNVYGLGKYINSDLVDKWTLYQIGQYCDTLVPDGFGGLEPRFTCNLLINTTEEAYRVINDMASIFNAMTYYAAGSIYVTQDAKAQKDDFFLFTNANVENGDFQYSSSSKRVRHTVALIRYNDKNNFYKPAVEYVEDIEGIKRYGIRQTEVTAFGCTSRGQAIRLGRWALLTETLNTESINFTAGLDATYLRPGDVFKVFDFNRKNKRFGGRTTSINVNQTGAAITLDSSVTGFNNTNIYAFSLLTPTYNYDSAQVTITDSSDISNIRRNQVQKVLFSGLYAGTNSNNKTEITFQTGFLGGLNVFDTGNAFISGNLIWTIEATGITGQYIDSNQHDYFKLIRKEEKEGFKYQVSAISYNEDKFRQIESGLSFDVPSIASTTMAPNNLALKKIDKTKNTKFIDYSFGIQDSSGVSAFMVYAANGTLTDLLVTGSNTNLINILPASTLSGTYIPLSNGTYDFRVYSVNRLGNKSAGYANNSIVIDGINPLADVIISSLNLSTGTGINAAADKITGTYFDYSPTFKWQIGYQQDLNIQEGLYYRLTFREPSKSNVPNKNIYFEVTGYLPDDFLLPTYQFDINNNINGVGTVDRKTGPFREYDVVVETMTVSGFSSAGGKILNTDADYSNSNGYDILYVNNPRIGGVDLTDSTISQNLTYATNQWITTDGDIKISFSGFNPDQDIAGAYIYYSTNAFTKTDVKNYVSNTSNPKYISNTFFEGFENPLIVAPSFTGVGNGYIAMSLVDTFDRIINAKGVNVLPDLYVSNTVQVRKRGDFINVSNAYQAWVDIIIGTDGSLTWEDASSNISSISYVSAQNMTSSFVSSEFINTIDRLRDGYIVTFKQSQANNRYGVVFNTNWTNGSISQNGLPSLPYVSAKSTNKLAFRATSSQLSSLHIFIGILS